MTEDLAKLARIYRRIEIELEEARLKGDHQARLRLGDRLKAVGAAILLCSSPNISV